MFSSFSMLIIQSKFQTIKSLQVLQRTETQWNIMIEKVFELEDTLKNQISRDRRYKRTFQKEYSWFTRFVYTSTIGKSLSFAIPNPIYFCF